MLYKGGWLGLCQQCCEAMLILEPFLYLSPGPGGKSMSAGVICLIHYLSLRAWCAQGPGRIVPEGICIEEEQK